MNKVLPARIKIGGIEYEIEEQPGLLDDNNSFKVDGKISFSHNEIFIELDLSQQAKFVTLWHEILHGILRHANYKNDDEEKLVDILSYGICGVIQDNPEFLS